MKRDKSIVDNLSLSNAQYILSIDWLKTRKALQARLIDALEKNIPKVKKEVLLKIANKRTNALSQIRKQTIMTKVDHIDINYHSHFLSVREGGDYSCFDQITETLFKSPDDI